MDRAYLTHGGMVLKCCKQMDFFFASEAVCRRVPAIIFSRKQDFPEHSPSTRGKCLLFLCLSKCYCDQNMPVKSIKLSPAAFCTKEEWRKWQSQLVNKDTKTLSVTPELS